MAEKPEKVGTNYEKKVIAKEINASERDEFWRKEEEEEKKRQNAEAERKRVEAAKIEAERLKREENANKADTGTRYVSGNDKIFQNSVLSVFRYRLENILCIEMLCKQCV